MVSGEDKKEKPKEGEKTLGDIHEVMPVPDMEDVPPRIYANGATIHHSSMDFTITFYDFVPPLEMDLESLGKNKDGKLIIKAPVVARIAMKPDIMKAFIDALISNYKRFCETDW